MQFDSLTFQTIKELWLPFLPFIVGYAMLVAMVFFLTRQPKATHYAYIQPSKSRRFNGLTVRRSALQRFRAKTRSYSLYGRDKHISKPIDEARVSAVGTDIDRYANRVTTATSSGTDYSARVLEYGRISASRQSSSH